MISYEAVHSLLRYDQETGMLHWKNADKLRKSSRSSLLKVKYKSPTVAGGIEVQGYIVINVKGKLYKAHRLVWLMVYGKWPEKHLDHLDRNRTNNKLENLVEADNFENGKNKSKQRNNSSGVTGVGKCSDRDAYYANIRSDGILYHKKFKTFEEAALWRTMQEIKFGFTNG